MDRGVYWMDGWGCDGPSLLGQLPGVSTPWIGVSTEWTGGFADVPKTLRWPA